MADISALARVINGALRNVDLSSNTLVTTSVKVGGGVSNTELTKTILDRLVTLQNGSDVDATYHTHDTRYFTQTQLGQTSTPSGASRIGVSGTPTNYTPSANNVQAHLQAIDAALASVASALDGTFRIENTSDTTKKIAFSAAGITTGTTRTITMPDADVNLGQVNTSIQQNGSRAFTADQSHGGFKITNVADPVNPQDVATKNYTDNLAHGLSWKNVVRTATTTALPANTYSNGSSGVGATLTGNVNGALSAQDGVTLVANDRILVKNEATSANDGVYVLTQVGDGSHPYILTRATDANTALELEWLTVEISPDASTQAGYIYREASDITTIGTDPTSWTLVSHGLDWTFNNGLSVTGNQVNVAPGDASLLATAGSLVVQKDGAGAIVTSGSGIKVQLESSNPSLQITSNQLGVKFDPAGAITSGASGIKVGVDNSTIEINTNALRVKDAGITAAKINTNVFDQVTITGGAGSAAAVQSAPKTLETLTAGQSFSANTSYAVRWGIQANGESIERVYAADKNATSLNNFYVIGIALSTSSVTAGQSITVYKTGLYTLGSSDTAFASSDVGNPVFLGSSGSLITSSSLTNTSGEAQTRVGMIRNTTKIDIAPQFMGVT